MFGEGANGEGSNCMEDVVNTAYIPSTVTFP